MEVVDRRALAPGKYRSRRLEAITTAVVHRTADKPLEDLAALFKDPGLGTGGAFPYHFIIEADGTISQMVRLGSIAPGAGALNPHGVQIALPGDFRKQAAPVEQVQSLIDLLAVLLHYAPNISRHSPSIPGASKDPKKECPGAHLDVTEVHARAKQRRASVPALDLSAYGIVI